MRARHGRHSLRLAPAHLGLAVDSHAEGLAGVQALLAGRGEVAGLAGADPVSHVSRIISSPGSRLAHERERTVRPDSAGSARAVIRAGGPLLNSSPTQTFLRAPARITAISLAVTVRRMFWLH